MFEVYDYSCSYDSSNVKYVYDSFIYSIACYFF